ncbi:rootletin-like [Sycon ciliatum]|uniref:rootletin-like n=1 Tax=Sycon ciliatum TaxID=27933 RepID=UPI0031F6D864
MASKRRSIEFVDVSRQDASLRDEHNKSFYGDIPGASSRSAAVELLRPVDTSQHVSFAAQPSVHTVSADNGGPVIMQKVDDGVSDSLVSCDDMSQDELESEFDNLVRLLEVSRKDTGALQAKVREQNNQIYTLQRDLAGASAQLADLQASRTQESMEIERCLKQELNAKHELIQRQLGEIRTMKEESQRHSTDMEAQVAETQYAHQLLEASHGVESDQRQELKQARMQWKSGVRAHRQELSHLNEKHQKTFSLAEVGARCQAQNHDRVIRDQSAALATLRRGETRSPAATTPGLSSSARMDVDSQQLQDTRRQLALQNKAALATTAELLTTTSSNNSEYELIRNQLEAERHAQHELLATLEESEKVTSSNNSEYELIRNQLEAERHAQHELLATLEESEKVTSSNNSEYELIRNQLEAERHAQHELLATLEESEKVVSSDSEGYIS